jgi:hypothetical protein
MLHNQCWVYSVFVYSSHFEDYLWEVSPTLRTICGKFQIVIPTLWEKLN